MITTEEYLADRVRNNWENIKRENPSLVIY